MSIYSTYTMLHHCVKASDGDESLNNALKTCHSFLEKYVRIHLGTASSVQDALQNNKKCVSILNYGSMNYIPPTTVEDRAKNARQGSVDHLLFILSKRVTNSNNTLLKIALKATNNAIEFSKWMTEDDAEATHLKKCANLLSKVVQQGDDEVIDKYLEAIYYL